MELKNAEPNGCDVLIKNQNPKTSNFEQILKIELNKELQSSF